MQPDTHDPVELAVQRIRDWAEDLSTAAGQAGSTGESLMVAAVTGELITELTAIQNLALWRAWHLPRGEGRKN